MKSAARNAHRWLRQAQYDLSQAERLLEEGVYSYAAFFSEQAAQKALNAFLLSRGRRLVIVHSVGELATQAAEFHAGFAPLIDAGKRLDRHYLTARYPDALPEPAIPAEAYVRQDAEEAVSAARKIFEMARSSVPAASGGD